MEDFNNPLRHVSAIQQEFEKIILHLREDVVKVDDPKAKALFETSAEVLKGLTKAFMDYAEKKEEAWR